MREKEDSMQLGSCAPPKYHSAAPVGEKNTEILARWIISLM